MLLPLNFQICTPYESYRFPILAEFMIVPNYFEFHACISHKFVTRFIYAHDWHGHFLKVALHTLPRLV